MITEEEYKALKEKIKQWDNAWGALKAHNLHAHRTPEMERGFLDYLRGCGVEGYAIDVVRDLFKQVKPKRNKRGRPKARPNPNLVAGHPRTLRRHKSRFEEMTKRMAEEEANWEEAFKWRLNAGVAVVNYELVSKMAANKINKYERAVVEKKYERAFLTVNKYECKLALDALLARADKNSVN